jgi:signal transduction histidine kinase
MKKIFFISLFFGLSIPSFSQVEYKELEKIIRANPDSVIQLINEFESKVPNQDSLTKYNLLKIKSNLYVNNLDSAELLIEKVLSSSKNDTILLETNYYKGIIYFYRGQLDEGLAFYNKLLKEAVRMRDTTMIGKVSANLSSNYIRQNRYDSALVYLKNTLEIDQKNNDSNYIASDYNLFGICYHNLKLFDQANAEYRKALEYKPDPITLGTVYMNMGIVYSDLNENDSTLLYSRKAEEIFLKYNNEQHLSSIYSILGIAYQTIGNYNRAINYFNKAVVLSKKKENNRTLSAALLNLSTTYFLMNRSNEAVRFGRQAFQLDYNSDHIDFAINSARGLALVYAQAGEIDSSVAYLAISDTMQQRHLKDSYFDKLSTVQGDLQLAEKEAEIAKTQLEVERQEVEIEVGKTRLVISIVGIGFILLIGILLFLLFKQRKKRDLSKAIIREQEKGISAVFIAQEDERKRISKDLHDGVGQQLSGLKMAFQKLGSELKTSNPEKELEVDRLSRILTESADEVRSISHQMMPKALTELGLIEALEDMFSKSLGINEINYQFEHYGINERLSERIEISLYRVTQELVNNIIKHSKANKVSIQLFKNGGKIILILEDNGTGIKDEKGDGHGLLNIRSRINTLNGDINLEPSPNSGTLATIRIPIN